MVCQIATDLSEITLAHMRPLLGREFLSTGPGGRRVALVLVGVTDMRPRIRCAAQAEDASARDLSAASSAGENAFVDPKASRPFSLLFLGPPDRPLLDAHYDVEIPWLCLSGLRLTPMGPVRGEAGHDGLLYEAVLD